MIKKNSKKGFSLVEVLIMVFIASFTIFIVWRVYVLYIKISVSNPATFQASFLAEEGIEAVKFMRDSNWTANIATLTPDIPYTLTFDGVVWGVTTTPIYVLGQFDRRVTLSNVNRDVFGNISDSGNIDVNTKKIVVEVSWWKDIATTTRTITTYVSNIFDN
ncbi:MAG: hypothetical protein AAB446_03360 [Patescibacteria group bacterium]